jgi:hypothetical protein
MSNRKLPIIHEGLETGKNGRRIKTNNKGKVVYSNNGELVYSNNGELVYNNNRKPVYSNNGNPVYNNGNPVYNNGNINQFPKKIKIQIHPVSKFSYIIEKNGEVEKKIKLDSQGIAERYSNGRPVILGEHGYAVNNKGQILKFDQITGDLSKNKNGNPYVYNPYPGGFKIHKNEIKYRYPQFTSTQIQHINKPSMSVLNAQGPGQTQVPTVFGRKQEYIPPGGFKVHKTPPESVLKYNNRIPGNNDSITSPLLQKPGNLKNSSNKGALSRLFGKLSIFGKKK